jgi:hypothetical protein
MMVLEGSRPCRRFRSDASPGAASARSSPGSSSPAPGTSTFIEPHPARHSTRGAIARILEAAARQRPPPTPRPAASSRRGWARCPPWASKATGNPARRRPPGEARRDAACASTCAACRATDDQLARAAAAPARPMTQSLLRDARCRGSCSRRIRRAGSSAFRSTRSAAPTRAWAGAVAGRDRLPASTLRRARPRAVRRRADDVRAGEFRALPAQDLQRQLTHRRRATAAVAVRDDPATRTRSRRSSR